MKGENWELPTGAHNFFPRTDTDRLVNEDNYLVWAARMKLGFKAAKLMDVVDGTDPKPSTSGDTKEIELWEKKDFAAQAMIMGCVTNELVIKISEAKTAKDAWDSFATEFGQTGSGSLMLWIKQLVRPMAPGDDVSEHVSAYQKAARHLTIAGFEIPEAIAAGILLSTLPSNPDDPASWNHFVSSIKIDQKLTTMSAVVNAILEEKRRLTSTTNSDSRTQESALAALEASARKSGKKFCRNCRREGHEVPECWAPGGGKAGKGPKRKAKGKKKEKANEVTEPGGGDEDSNHVIYEKSFMAAEAEFSLYSGSELSQETHQDPKLVEDQSYRIRSANGPPPVIIDSGTSSHIHSIPSDFVTSNPNASGDIRGFGGGRRRIIARGEAHLHATHPKGGTIHLRLKNTCLVPDSTSTLISVSRLDDSGCYTVFGDGKCVTFEKKDSGKFMNDLIIREKIVLTGSRADDRLYYLNAPRTTTEISNLIVPSPSITSTIEKLHHKTGHLNYPAIKWMYREGYFGKVKLSKTELNSESPVCASCMKGKITRASFPPSTRDRATKRLGRVYSDLWGPAPVSTPNGSRYAMTFTDDNSRLVWIYFLRMKSQAFETFKVWLEEVERERQGRNWRNCLRIMDGSILTNRFRISVLNEASRSERLPLIHLNRMGWPNGITGLSLIVSVLC